MALLGRFHKGGFATAARLRQRRRVHGSGGGPLMGPPALCLHACALAAIGKGVSMRHLRNALAAAPLLFGACAPGALLTPVLAQTCACPPEGGAAAARYVIQADEPPPPLPEY